MPKGSVVLVTGLLPYDSGKTWFSLALVKELRALGVKAGYAKPVAGHNAWHQFATVLRSIEKNMLVGEDVSRYEEMFGDDLRIVNPVDLLLVPHDPAAYSSFDEYYSRVEEQIGHVVLARFSKCTEKTDKHYQVKDSLPRVLPSMRVWIEKLAQRLGAEEIDTNTLLEMLKSREVEEELMKCLDILRSRYEIVVVESFNNAAVPFAGILKVVDLPIMVMPGYVVLLDTESFRDKVIKNAYTLGDEGLAMDKVVESDMAIHSEYLEPVLEPQELTPSSIAEKVIEILRR